MEPEQAFLNAQQVGKRIGRGEDTVRRMWDEGVLPFTTVNGRRLTPTAALETWLARLAEAAMDNVKET